MIFNGNQFPLLHLITYITGVFRINIFCSSVNKCAKKSNVFINIQQKTCSLDILFLL